ncbi:MAG: extracellular solute-binding protein [Lachnospiraceae bacterium]|nr:extracellular solute-binding protein [Lachnospiraceae bacterium]
MKSQKLLASFIMILTIMLVIVLSKYYIDNTKPKELPEINKKITIMSIYEDKVSNEVLESIVAEYSAMEGNPSVEIRFINQANFQKELCICKDQNKLPDIVIMENIMTSSLQSMDILWELTDYMTDEKISEYTVNSYNSTLVNGISYAVPFDSDPMVLFYNEDYFDSYGEDIPDSLSEFYQMCERTKKLGTYNLGLAVKDKEDISAVFSHLIMNSGGNIRDLESENCTGLYKIIERMRENEILAPDTINWNQNDLMEAFAQGYVKSAIARLSAISILEQRGVEFSYDIAEIPAEQRKIYLLEGQNIGITTTADKREALKVMDYLLRKENIERYCRSTYHLSVRNDLLLNPAVRFRMMHEYIAKEREQSILRSSYSTWFLISDAISGNLTNFLGNHTQSAEDFGKQIQEDVRNAIMER